jgi:hypothetical protein
MMAGGWVRAKSVPPSVGRSQDRDAGIAGTILDQQLSRSPTPQAVPLGRRGAPGFDALKSDRR